MKALDELSDFIRGIDGVEQIETRDTSEEGRLNLFTSELEVGSIEFKQFIGKRVHERDGFDAIEGDELNFSILFEDDFLGSKDVGCFA